MPATAEDLRQHLHRIDGRGYKAYKDIQGSYAFDGLTLHIDHVQGDPFAAPSKLRVRVPMDTAQVPAALFNNEVRRIALEDFLARQVAQAIRRFVQGQRGTGKSGLVSIDAGAQEVIERTAAVVHPQWVEARIEAGLPAGGRRVLGRQAEAMLCGELPRVAEHGLRAENLDAAGMRAFVECVENQEHLRGALEARGLVAFVADGALLPRASGASDQPMKRGDAVPFTAPESLRVTFSVPNPVDGQDALCGLGVPEGVTLIVGGGYHGKSTLLQALERGVYPHIPGDGREYVVTRRDAVKIRAEDGRAVARVDISPFINNLPRGRDTRAFSTEDASGSTSQAASIVEALEMGARTLLLDEDTSATNFMVRDARMQALVQKEHEPITPFVDRVREMHETRGVSTVLVMGGCGDYFDVADTVIMMRAYQPHNVIEEVRQVVADHPTRRAAETPRALDDVVERCPVSSSFDASRGRRDIKIDAKALDLILFGEHAIDLRGVEQIVDLSQTRAIGQAIRLAAQRHMDGAASLREAVEAVEAQFERGGLDVLDPYHRGEEHPGNFARPRKYEIAAAINRLRTVRMKQRGMEPPGPKS